MLDRSCRLIVALVYFLLVGVVPALPQAALLPDAKQTYFDDNGNPLSNGKVYYYVPGTVTPKQTWQDSTQTVLNPNPVPLDAAGRAVMYGQGSYQQRVVKANGDQVWSAPTTAYGSSAPSGASGTDTAPVGTIIPFAGFSLPVNWAWANGDDVSRADYADLLATVTIADSSVTCTSGSPVLAGWDSTAQMRVGAPVEATCISTGAVIVKINSATSITVSVNAGATSTTLATVFPWGNGDGAETFSLPDLRGRTLVGPDALGGSAAAGRLSQSTTISTTSGNSSATVASAAGVYRGMTVVSANVPNGTVVSDVVGSVVTLSNNASASASGTAVTFYAFTGANAAGASGGAGGVDLVQSELSEDLGSATSVVTDPGHTHNLSLQGTGAGGASANATISPFVATGGTGVGSTVSATTGITVATTITNADGGSLHSTLQPSLASNYIVKVKANTTGAGGVVSIGGMFGDILCGAGMTCEDQTITATNPALPVNAQTGTSYEAQCEDNGHILTLDNGSPVAVTLPAPAVAPSCFANGYWLYIQNLGVGTVTVTPASGSVMGQASFDLSQNDWALVASDAANYQGWLQATAESPQTLINKTFDTADNTFKVNGTPWVGIGSSLEFNGTTLQRSAITGVVTAAADSNTTTFTNGSTGSGAVVLAISPTITSPSLITPSLGVASATSLAINGCTIGTDALCATGTGTVSGILNVGGLNVMNTVAPANGFSVSGANTLVLNTNTTPRFTIDSGGLQANSSSGGSFSVSATSSTSPAFAPRRADSTTGIGAQATGNMSMIVGGAEKGRWTSTGLNNADIGQTTPGLGTFTTVSASTYSGLPVVSDASGSPSITAGIMKCDGTTTSCASGVVTAIGGAATDVTVGTTTVSGGTNGRILFDNSGVLGEKTVTGTGDVVLATSPTLVTPTLGVASATSVNKVAITAPATSATLTIANGKTLTASNTLTFTGTDSSSVAFGTGGTVAYTIASGTKALATSAISSATCTSAQTATATGTLTTDIVTASFNGDPTAVTGYVPLTTWMLTIIAYPTADTVNFKVCNNTTGSITPGAITLNWRVTR